MGLTLQHLVLVALGGAVGSGLRFLMATGFQRWLGEGFPFGTLLVNVSGAFLIGAIYGYFQAQAPLAEPWRMLIVTGILGGFTTFSAFSLETFVLLQNGVWFKSVLNIILNVGLCLALTGLGMLCGKLLAY